LIGVDNMSRAVKAVSSQRGRDPRDFVLVAFGGAGPAYAVEMARVLGMQRVLVPMHPGLFCSIGLLAGDVQYDEVRTYTQADRLDPAAVDAMFNEMGLAIATTLERNGHGHQRVELARYADVHYAGQSSELRVPMSPGSVGEGDLQKLRSDFDAEHERTYGHRGDGQRMEIAALRVRATVQTGDVDRERLFAEAASPQGAVRSEGRGSRQAYFGAQHGVLETPIVDRHELGAQPLGGPLIIEEMDATTVIPPGATAVRDNFGNILIEVA
jgi:N-methylhydantoinase A